MQIHNISCWTAAARFGAVFDGENMLKTLFLVVLALASSAILIPSASANPPEGYTCVFGYNPDSVLNVCVLADDIVIIEDPTPCVVGDFPCGTVPTYPMPSFTRSPIDPLNPIVYVCTGINLDPIHSCPP